MSAADAAPATPPMTRIVRPEARRTIEAIERLVAGSRSDRAHARRFLNHARQARLPLDDLWSLERTDGRLSHSALAIPGAGNIAMIVATRPESDDEIAVVAPLVAHAARQVAVRGVRLSQALVDPRDLRERRVLLDAGFTELARLSYLERPIPVRGSVAPVAFPSGVSVRPWSPGDRGEMVALLDATYEETLDCPALCGLRRTEDILDGHLHSGRFEPALWTVLEVESAPAGVMLLSAAHGGQSIELVYFGLARAARGRGLGALLLQHGLRSVSGRRESTISLAVDEENEPALRLYRAAGFHSVARRVAFVMPLPA